MLVDTKCICITGQKVQNNNRKKWEVLTSFQVNSCKKKVFWLLGSILDGKIDMSKKGFRKMQRIVSYLAFLDVPNFPTRMRIYNISDIQNTLNRINFLISFLANSSCCRELYKNPCHVTYLVEEILKIKNIFFL